MEQTNEMLLQFRQLKLVSAEKALIAAIEARREAVYNAIMTCKHEHVGQVGAAPISGRAAGRICLQCGLFEESYGGGVVLKHVGLPYHITADISRLITVRLDLDHVSELLRTRGANLPDIIQRLVNVYC